MNSVAVPDLSEAGVHAERFSVGGMDAFFVEYPLHQEKRRLLAIAVDDDGLVNVAKEDVAFVDGEASIRARARALVDAMVPGAFDGEDVELCLKDLGILPCDYRRGISGDTAVSVGCEMVRRFPPLNDMERIDLVEALHVQMLGRGLSAVLERIGSGRLEISGLIASATKDGESLRGLMRRSISHLAPLRCPGDRVKPNLAIVKAFPAFLKGIDVPGLHEGDERAVLLAAMKDLDVPPHLVTPLVRRLAGVAVIPLSARFIAWLGEIPMDWIPGRDDVRGWKACRLLLPLIAHVANETDTPIRQVCGDAGADWDGYGTRLCARLGFDWETILNAKGMEAELGNGMLLKRACLDIVDVARGLSDTVVRPCLAFAGAGESDCQEMSMRLLFQGRTFASTLITSATWHRRGVGLPDCDLGNWSWAPLLPAWMDKPSGIEFVVLTDRAALLAEGAKGTDATGAAGLNHCVGGYGERCLRGQSTIVSLRRREGDGYRRLSTAEIRIEPQGVRVVQHRGMGNGEPAPDASAAFSRYVEGLENDPALPIDRAGWQEPRRRGAPDLERICGYDWRDESAILAALRAWRSYLTKRSQDLDVDGLMNALGVDRPTQPSP